MQRQAAENLEKEVARKTHDLKQRTQELESAYTRLAEHDRLKSRFFTNISHELRTPLTLILAPLKRMLTEEQAKLPPGIIQRLEAMVGNTHRLLRLVNQLLDFSRLESGSETVSNQWVDLHSIVGGVIRAFEPFARSKGLSLELRAPKKMQKVFTDSQKLDKVLCNLLSNACKFTKEGGSIVVRIEETKEQVSIAVKDTGIGIAIDDQNRIFERFYQVDSSTSRRFEGTGIGLSLSRELIELCRGTLTVESEPDAGSTFIITLPCEKGGSPPAKATAPEIVESMERRAHNTAAALEAELGMRNIRRSAVSEGQHLSGNEKLQPTKQADAPQKAQSEPPILENAGVSIINNTKPKVVVIDDNADMRDLVAEICEQDFETVQAADGSAGLDVIHKTKPALIISDIMMPVMDGYELLRRVREDPATASIPILLLTAKSGDEMRLEGLESGADDYLVKPFDARELLARTRNLIRLCEQEQELKRLNSELQQEVIYLATRLDRARRLQQFLPPKIASKILEEGQPVEIAQERQPITVFSMKIKGFDRLSEAIAPEDMAAMLNSYLSSAVDVVFSNGGTLNTLLQDLIVGFVGAPESQGAKEDAIICARMSQELLKRTAEVCNGWQAIISEAVPSPAISVASGYAVVGNFGTNHRIEYSAVGRLVNEALAMLEHSKCGEVVCNQRTLSLIDGTLEGQLSAQMMFMNRSKPVNIYRIASLSGAAMPHQSHSETISISGQLSSQLNPNPTQKNFIDAPPTLLTPTSEGKKGGSPSSNLKKSSRIGVGTVLADRFRIERCLGEGGMGEIFLAIDLKLETAVALKVVRQDLKRERHIKSLYREVKLTRLINHPNVAQMHNLHEWQEHEFITMEYIEGQSLEERLKENPSISIDRAKHILLQLCTGLSAAHLAGVVHGDLKPANIMLGQNWRTVILDFGISRWITSPSMTNTQTNTYCGTPFYMAPEQFEGKPLDIRSDIYSLGVVAFELFTGRKPFVADHVVRLAYLHAQEKPPDPLDLRSGLHPRIAAVILRCLEKAPKNRFNAVAEISALLSENRPEMRRTSVQLGR